MAEYGPRATGQREPGWRKEGDLAGPISREAIETRLYLNSTAQPRDEGSWGYIPLNGLLVLQLKITFRAKSRTFKSLDNKRVTLKALEFTSKCKD